MNLRNCPRCGRLFAFSGRDLCPTCLREEEQSFDRVKAYLSEHAGAGVDEVSQATEVSVDRIIQFLRQGRLIMANSGGALRCESCGRPIQSGRLCSECAERLRQEIGESQAKAARDRYHTERPRSDT